jgi:hypothetical protein
MAWLVLIVMSLVAAAEPYGMNDLGGALDLPDSWKGKSWSDTDLEAETRGKQGKLTLRVWMSDYQVPIDVTSRAAFTADYARRLGVLGGKRVRLLSSDVETFSGRTTLWAKHAFDLGGGVRAVAQTAAFAGYGNVIHIRVLCNEHQAPNGLRALKQFVQTFDLQKKPGKTAGKSVEAEDGFASVLPDGWRTPIGGERARVRKITDKLWASKKGTEPCWVALRPVAVGSPDVMFACGRSWSGVPVDEHSMSAVDEEFRDLFFRDAAAEIAPAESVSVGDRMGLLFRPREGINAIRLIAAPYDRGLVAIWARAGSLEGAALDAAISAAAESTTFTGPEGGKPNIRADKWVGYYLAHRPTSPIVLAPALGIVGLVGFLVARRKKSGDAEWNEVTEV